MNLLINTDKANNLSEIVDIVDSQDNIIGEMLKIEANQNPNVIHREIGILLFNDDNKILWQQRSIKKLISPGVWTVSVGGHVTKGMEPIDAAHMEIKEELGFDCKLIFIEKSFTRRINEANFFYWFIGKYNNEAINFEPEEVEKVEFLDQAGVESIADFTNPVIRFEFELCKRFWNGEFDKFKEQLN